ncbi:MAG: hypothetical protein AAFY59_15905 [Pseudomonadota bacterium]
MRLREGVLAGLLGATVAGAEEIAHFPAAVDPGCRGGIANLYDECGSQFDVLAAAEAEAARTGRVLLVIYGAEWCIWCHVLSAHLEGQAGVFSYRFEGQAAMLVEGAGLDRAAAEALRAYVAETFVIAHIEGEHAHDGDFVLEELGAWGAYENWIPFAFTMREGRFAAALGLQEGAEDLLIRRDGVLWYRGYRRDVLMKALRRMEAAAR